MLKNESTGSTSYCLKGNKVFKSAVKQQIKDVSQGIKLLQSIKSIIKKTTKISQTL